MDDPSSRVRELQDDNDELRRRLAEAEDTLKAIQAGEVDAIVVEGVEGSQIFSLAGAERIYRVLVETMYEAGLTIDAAGTIVFNNLHFAQLLGKQPNEVLGQKLEDFALPSQRDKLEGLLARAQQEPAQERVVLVAADGTEVPVQVAASLLEVGDTSLLCVVATDLRDLEASYRAIDTLRDHQRDMEEAQEELRKSQVALQQSQEEYRVLATENERLYRLQLDIAQSLQGALFNIPAQIGAVRVDHIYRSATESARVGGDFYDVFEVKDNKVAVLIGDVSGHGIDAARSATLVRDVIHAFSHQSIRPHEVLRRTNALLIEKQLIGFVTVFFGILDADYRIMRYASAGHPETLLRRTSGQVELLGSGSSPLGVFPDAFWKPGIVELRPGDLLFLYTDGVVEARRDGDFFGRKRLETLLQEKDLRIQAVPEMVLEQVLAFSDGRLDDDVALLALLVPEPAEDQRLQTATGV